MPRSAEYWIKELDLQPHIEGGAFRELYRSGLQLPRAALTAQHVGARAAMTCIYFLLRHGEFSAFHRIASDEIWHHYEGATLCIYEIAPHGQLTKHLLGKDVAAGCSPALAIAAGSWFASRVEEPGGFTLCGCTVAPGFDFEDFELAERGELVKLYPVHEQIIKELTR